jgi:hypothetical protein
MVKTYILRERSGFFGPIALGLRALVQLERLPRLNGLESFWKIGGALQLHLACKDLP